MTHLMQVSSHYSYSSDINKHQQQPERFVCNIKYKEFVVNGLKYATTAKHGALKCNFKETDGSNLP